MRFLQEADPSLLAQVWDWFTTPENWQGKTGIVHRLWEHTVVSFSATFVGLLIGLPLGAWVGHTGRGAFAIVQLANVGRAIPSFGILVLGVVWFGIGVTPIFIVLTLLAIPPIVTNTYTGVAAVDAELVEAAAGMGMSSMQQLLRVKLPVALPLILGGVRTAAVQVVATAPLAAFVAWGGLGRFIVDGLATRSLEVMLAGAILVALLAIATEVAFAIIERVAVSRGLSTRRRARRLRPAAVDA